MRTYAQIINEDAMALNKWAKKVYARENLNEDEQVISEYVEELVNKLDRVASASAKEEIASIIIQVVEPEVFDVPNAMLEQVLEVVSIGEFDKVKVNGSPKNTLVAYESAPRTGNVNKSYIDYAQGTIKETHLQIETELKMANLRREGAFGVAYLASMALQEFNRAKFRTILQWIEATVAGGSNIIDIAGGEIVADEVKAFTKYLKDNNFGANRPVIFANSSTADDLADVTPDKWLSNELKNEFNSNGYLGTVRGCQLAQIPAGMKDGRGQQLIANDVAYGFADKVGFMYTAGAMRTLQSENINDETIHFKFTGVQFGIYVDPNKINHIAILKNNE